MSILPKGLGLKDYWKLILLSLKVWRNFGYRTLWRKIRSKLEQSEDELYHRWCQENAITAEQMERQREQALKFFYRPLISVIMPVYNPALAVLKAAVESVLQQTYDHWELCMADGSDLVSGTEIKELLRKYAQKDKRIRINYLEKNKGISGNSNEALKMAEGAFVAFLDHDDTIAPFALFRMVERLNQNPDLDLLYSDRDLLSWDGQKRFRPFFKPDWSPETLVSVNYLIHMAVIRKSLVDRSGGFFEEMDGAQDWDLFFRITEMTSNVAHVPGILYHWRVGPKSAAWSLTAKPYVVQAQFQAIRSHLGRLGNDIEVSLGRSGFIKVNWKEENKKRVSILLSSSGSLTNLKKSLNSIVTKTSYPDYDVILFSNREIDQIDLNSLAKSFKGHSKRIITGNENFETMENIDFSKFSGDFLIFMNGDLEVIDPEWMTEMAGWLGQKEIGAVGGKIMRHDGTIQTEGLVIDQGNSPPPFSGLKEYFGMCGSSEWYWNYQAVSGSFMAIRKDVLGAIDNFKPSDLNNSDNIKFYVKLRERGYRIVYSPYSRARMI